MNDTEYLRHLTRLLDRARREGWPAYRRHRLVQRLVTAAEVVQDDEWETMDESTWRQADILANVHIGRCPLGHHGAEAFDYFTPADIRDQRGRFLSKLVRERIYAAWQGGGRQDVAFFLALVPRLASSMSL